MIYYSLKNKNCLVTGGSRGIGKSIVDTLLNQDAKVISVARNMCSIKCDGQYFPYDCDLLEKESLEIFCDQVMKEHGLPDVIIHNVGGSYQITSEFAPANEWEMVWRFNVGISVDINNFFIKKMLEKKHSGKIIHISSAATKTLLGYAPYISAKSALNGYIKTMASRYSQYGILINGVSPGAVRLPNRYFANLEENNPDELSIFLDHHVAIKRLAKPEEISSVVLFLASDAASYMTGAVIDVDGGLS